MEGKYALLVFVLQWTIYRGVLAAGEDSTSRSGYFITRENKRLTGHVVKWFESPSLMSCSQSCLRNAWCSSTNFKVSSQKDGRGTCELNKHDSPHNTKLNEQQGFIFSMFLKILDAGFCDATYLVGLRRGPNTQLSYAKFIEHFYHVLEVPKIEGVVVQTGSQCLLQCVNNDHCFSTNVGAFYLPNGKLSCDLLSNDKYNTSEKFKTSDTFHHYSILSHCASFPCQHGGSCRALYEIDDYSCTCKQNYTGKNCENLYLTWYKVVVKTSNVHAADTDANVYIRINGTTGYIEKHLDNEEDNFEKGSEDTFIFQDKDYIGALRSVSIKRDNRGQYAGWHLETVSVARSLSEDGFKEGLENAYGIQCSYNKWVEADKWIQLQNE